MVFVHHGPVRFDEPGPTSGGEVLAFFVSAGFLPSRGSGISNKGLNRPKKKTLIGKEEV